jgi:predicted transcriptional regulator
MTFSVHIDEPTAAALARAVRASGRTRNALIRQAIREWLASRERTGWPAVVREFKGVKDAVRFERDRDTLLPPPADPLAPRPRSRKRR